MIEACDSREVTMLPYTAWLLSPVKLLCEWQTIGPVHEKFSIKPSELVHRLPAIWGHNPITYMDPLDERNKTIGILGLPNDEIEWKWTCYPHKKFGYYQPKVKKPESVRVQCQLAKESLEWCNNIWLWNWYAMIKKAYCNRRYLLCGVKPYLRRQS